MQGTTILVVEDDRAISDAISGYLRAEGFMVYTAFDGPDALIQARAFHPDLMILDIRLPGIDGIEVCRRLQRELDLYVIMLSAQSDEINKVVGLAVGADDYLTKPFSPRELLLRVRAVLRRNRSTSAWAYPQEPPTPTTLRFEGLSIDPEHREVRCAQLRVDLTPREFDLLHTLATNPGHIFHRTQLIERVWGPSFAGVDRVVDVHIGLLRRKIHDDAEAARYIETVRGLGYRFVGRRINE